MDDIYVTIGLLERIIFKCYQEGINWKLGRTIRPIDESIENKIDEIMSNFISCNLIPDEILKEVIKESFIAGHNFNKDYTQTILEYAVGKIDEYNKTNKEQTI